MSFFAARPRSGGDARQPFAVGAWEPPTPPHTLGLGLAPAVGIREPVAYKTTPLREARKLVWESRSSRQEWLMYRTGALGPPESAERVPLFAIPPLEIDTGPDWRPWMTMLGHWSLQPDGSTAEETFGIVSQDAATLAVLVALLQGRD